MIENKNQQLFAHHEKFQLSGAIYARISSFVCNLAQNIYGIIGFTARFQKNAVLFCFKIAIF